MPDGSYFLTRYADIVTVYRDPQAFSSDKKMEFTPKYGAGSPLLEHHTTSLVFNDPPLHTRVRKLIMGALTRRAIADMEPGLVALVDRLLDRIARKGGGDLIEDFASAIPVEIIGNLLGVPACGPRPVARLVAGDPGRAGAQAHARAGGAGNRSVSEFTAYLETLVAERRERPGDPEHDVLTRLIQGEAAGEKAQRDRAAAELHLHPQRRPRNHHQPDRQRAGGIAGVARGERRPARAHATPGADPGALEADLSCGGRRIPALRVVQPARQPPRPARMRSGRRASRARRAGDAVHRRRQS